MRKLTTCDEHLAASTPKRLGRCEQRLRANGLRSRDTHACPQRWVLERLSARGAWQRGTPEALVRVDKRPCIGRSTHSRPCRSAHARHGGR